MDCGRTLEEVLDFIMWRPRGSVHDATAAAGAVERALRAQRWQRERAAGTTPPRGVRRPYVEPITAGRAAGKRRVPEAEPPTRSGKRPCASRMTRTMTRLPRLAGEAVGSAYHPVATGTRRHAMGFRASSWRPASLKGSPKRGPPPRPLPASSGRGHGLPSLASPACSQVTLLSAPTAVQSVPTTPCLSIRTD